MFEGFTDAARQGVVLAQEEARVAGHNHIATEHVLLGLVDQGGMVGDVLTGLGVTPGQVRSRVEALMPPRAGARHMSPPTSALARVLRRSCR